MNPWDLDATGLMVWGLAAHLVADWLFQTERMALGKAWPWMGTDALQAALHAACHVVALSLVFGPGVGLALGVVHLLIDTRIPTAWWGRAMRQTNSGLMSMHVAIWRDQVFHVVCIAAAALLVAG